MRPRHQAFTQANKAALGKVAKKIVGGAKSYARNVAGGARIVGGAVKRAAKKIF